MNRLLYAFALALTLVPALAHAGATGCTDAQKKAMNHNAADPTRPGVIGGCGTNPVKVDHFNRQQNQLRNQKIIQGPPKLNNGQSF